MLKIALAVYQLTLETKESLIMPGQRGNVSTILN